MKEGTLIFMEIALIPPTRGGSHTALQQSRPERTAHDREALRILDTWREDPEFEPVLEHLSAMTARLEQFTRVTPTAEP